MKPVHSQRLERWLGTERIEQLSRNFRGWYGPPVALLDVPGGVVVNGDGDFSGKFERGFYVNAADALHQAVKRAMRMRPRYGVLNAGFASISDALSEASAGKRQMAHGGMVSKVGLAPGSTGSCTDFWYPATNNPTAGATASTAAGAGQDATTAGAMIFTNPTGGDTTHLTGADFSCNTANHAIMLIDRLGASLRTASSSGNDTVTFTQSRYNSTTPGAADYAGGNFVYPVARGGALGAFAHNWTGQYTDQGGNTAQAFATTAGINACQQNRLDLPVNTWFWPLASGDTGVKALTQTACSVATVTGSCEFVLAHPIGIMTFPTANLFYPFDWLTNRDQAPRVMDSACLSMLGLPQPASAAITVGGLIYLTQG
ncbi:hypothetical protein UFOVP1040_16 [uncultured Caudovirales phage]|uniref:Uncharacterized protein n=1 Tax=uncultured Caudovirales phage TaxID=2100421 RepID=A0A6J5Q919_9CAUD|nr:hypothetical protein UFOVP1040_16 [uncultured Caudovirales phage]